MGETVQSHVVCDYTKGHRDGYEAGRTASVEMILTCPSCGERHIDEGNFATKRHHTHACQHCGMCWRPAIVCTVGVRFLPGFKNAAEPCMSQAEKPR